MAEKFTFNLPTGRIVQGSPSFKQTQDMKGNVKERPTWFFAVAVEKTDPEINNLLGQIQSYAWHAYTGHPQVQQRIAFGLNGGFAWKIEDGDDPKFAGKEGFAGCYIFKFSTTLGAPTCFNQAHQPIDPTTIKTGHYVMVSGNTSPNGNTDHTAGIYMNPEGVMFVAYGAEIMQGRSAEQMFGNAQVRLPAGASQTPVAPTNAPAAGGHAPQPPQGGMGGGHPQQPQQSGGFGQTPMQYQQGGFSAQPMPQHQQQQHAPQQQVPMQGGMGGQPQPGFTPNNAPPAPSGQPMTMQPAGGHVVGAPAPSNAGGMGGQPPGFQQGGQFNAPTADGNVNQFQQPPQQSPQPHTPPGGTGPGFAQQQNAPGTGGQPMATSSPTNQYPGAQPHPGFVQGGQQ